MQHLDKCPEGRQHLCLSSLAVRARVRFLAMFLRLCGPPSIPLSFNLAVVLPRWMTYRFRLATDPSGPAVSHHRLRRGLPGYLILFDPHAFVPQRQLRLREMPSQSVF